MVVASCRIEFLDPWKEKAENRAFDSLAEAAERVGHSLLHVSDSNEILAAAPDAVIAVASTQHRDSVRRFLEAVCAGYGKRGGVRRYSNTPEPQALGAEVEAFVNLDVATRVERPASAVDTEFRLRAQPITAPLPVKAAWGARESTHTRASA